MKPAGVLDLVLTQAMVFKSYRLFLKNLVHGPCPIPISALLQLLCVTFSLPNPGYFSIASCLVHPLHSFLPYSYSSSSMLVVFSCPFPAHITYSLLSITPFPFFLSTLLLFHHLFLMFIPSFCSCSVWASCWTPSLLSLFLLLYSLVWHRSTARRNCRSC